MPIFALNEEIFFPPPYLANPDGILAVGGDLSPERLILAYEMGIFPWYSPEEPIIWWSPDPRFVLYPAELRVSKSMRPYLNGSRFRVSFDEAFSEVVSNCQKIYRPGQQGTWITGEMLDAYCHLHEMGLAHSVEVWQEDQLVGGLYGISMGRCFFGESMFSKVSNASKTGFIRLIRTLEEKGFELIDCQVHTPHLESLGAQHIPRELFLKQLAEGLKEPSLKGNWSVLLSDS
ncbi:MAG: leucyl/phenylalanyl-tRNA--protein transferase [Bacteroidota bacterium]